MIMAHKKQIFNGEIIKFPIQSKFGMIEISCDNKNYYFDHTISEFHVFCQPKCIIKRSQNGESYEFYFTKNNKFFVSYFFYKNEMIQGIAKYGEFKRILDYKESFRRIYEFKNSETYILSNVIERTIINIEVNFLLVELHFSNICVDEIKKYQCYFENSTLDYSKINFKNNVVTLTFFLLKEMSSNDLKTLIVSAKEFLLKFDLVK
ncbi:hypothetical protein EDEG_00771 [Edhazardia aedis USNM 41457]|uniref:Uncharacterized protein n=1 Tax=Edhazardia aedis (strain USNM 41457) TaxID=1003232 RepID=J9DV28_EDHAE|nr:hypothetical protein EDEG_00771 [Edhazardia aedis USNM 41457]|eukprot:EJW05137.1 hypothetical protein EDEG_00771 [Edhazardia aedis USNM 41457]